MSESPDPEVVSYSAVGKPPRQTLAVIALACAVLGMLLTYLGGGPFGAPGVLLGAYALYRIRRTPSKHTGRVPAIASLCVGSVALALGAAIALELYLPSHFPRTITNEQWCAHKMRCIIQGFQIYARENGGRFPPDLETLCSTGFGMNKNMACPTTGRCYLPIPDAMSSTDPNAPVLLESPNSHPGGSHVAFADGRVVLLRPDEYARVAGKRLKTSKFVTLREFDREVNERIGLFRRKGHASTGPSSRQAPTSSTAPPARATSRVTTTRSPEARPWDRL